MKISALSQTKVGQFCVERELIYSTEQELQGWKEGRKEGGMEGGGERMRNLTGYKGPVRYEFPCRGRCRTIYQRVFVYVWLAPRSLALPLT